MMMASHEMRSRQWIKINLAPAKAEGMAWVTTSSCQSILAQKFSHFGPVANTPAVGAVHIGLELYRTLAASFYSRPFSILIIHFPVEVCVGVCKQESHLCQGPKVLSIHHKTYRACDDVDGFLYVFRSVRLLHCCMYLKISLWTTYGSSPPSDPVLIGSLPSR